VVVAGSVGFLMRRERKEEEGYGFGRFCARREPKSGDLARLGLVISEAY